MLTIVGWGIAGVLLVAWLMERSTRLSIEKAGRVALDRQKMLLARRVIVRHMPDAKESSDFWPYEDVAAAAFGKDEDERSRDQPSP